MAARMQGLKRFVAMIAAIAVCLVLHTGAALADERLCRQLEAQLAALSPGGGGGAQYRKYDKAIATQRDQLRQTRGRARASGCGFSLFGGGGGSGCARLNRTIDRMERNLSALQSKRTQLAGAGGMKRQRNRLLASLDANGCRDTRAQQREARRSLEQTSRGMTLFDRLFNGGVRPLEELEAEIPDNVRRVPERRVAGIGRTIPHTVRAHLRWLLFPDLAILLDARLRPGPAELRGHVPWHRGPDLLPGCRRGERRNDAVDSDRRSPMRICRRPFSTDRRGRPNAGATRPKTSRSSRERRRPTNCRRSTPTPQPLPHRPPRGA